MQTAYVGIGSNVDRERSVRRAAAALERRFGEVRFSGVYECAAVGQRGEPFYNLVACFESDEAPAALIAALHLIEDKCGRVREAGGPLARTLDLDLLLYGQMVAPEARLPREDVQRYAFVLRPLSELAGAARHPVTGLTYGAMWRDFDDASQAMWPAPLDLHPATAQEIP